MVFLPSKNFGYFYTNSPQSSIVQFDKQGNFHELTDCSPASSLIHGKVLRTDKSQDHLFINQGKSIRILFNLSQRTYQFEGNLKQFDNAEIDDFRIIKNNGVLSACSNMQLYYHEVDPNRGSRLVCKVDIGIPINERITSLAVDRFENHIAVATELNDELTNLIFFEIQSDKMIEFSDEMNFYYDEQTFKRQFNYIRDMSLELVDNGRPIIAAFQFAGDRHLMPFSFTDGKIIRYSPVRYNSGIFNKCCSSNGSVWTVDMNGVLKRLKLGARN